jgi:hypothetical protein
MSRIGELHRRWSKDADYEDAYDGLDEASTSRGDVTCTSTTLQILKQQCQRAIEDFSRIAREMTWRPSACTRRSFSCVSRVRVNCTL